MDKVLYRLQGQGPQHQDDNNEEYPGKLADVAKKLDVIEIRSSGGNNNHDSVSGELRDDKGEYSITEDSVARDCYQSSECSLSMLDLDESEKVENASIIVGEKVDGILTILLDDVAEISSLRDVDQAAICCDEYEKMKSKKVIEGKVGNEIQDIIVDQKFERSYLESMKEVVDIHTKVLETSEAIMENESDVLKSVDEDNKDDNIHKANPQLHMNLPKDCGHIMDATDSLTLLKEREAVGLLRDFSHLPPPIPTTTANQPKKNIKKIFNSFTGRRNRQKNVEKVIRDRSQLNEIITPDFGTREATKENIFTTDGSHDDALNSFHSHKSTSKQNISPLLKDFPPLPPQAGTMALSIKTRNRKFGRRKFEFGRVRSILSSVRTITSRDSIITPSTAKDSDQSSKMTRRSSIGQRFNMRFRRSKGGSCRASEVQEELLRHDDLVRDAVNRHRALTADQSEDISTGVDNVALEGHYLPRQTDVDR